MDDVPQGEARSPNMTRDYTTQINRNPTTKHENEQSLGAPQSTANYELRASVPEALDRNNDQGVPAPASQHLARPLLKVEREAASTLAGLRQVPFKPLTLPPAQHAASTSNLRPLWPIANSSDRRSNHGPPQLQQAGQDNNHVYLGGQKPPHPKYVVPRVKEPRGRAGTASTAAQRLPHEQMQVARFNRAPANASAEPAHVQVNRSIEHRQAAPAPFDPRGQRTVLPHGQRMLPNYHTGPLAAHTATALAASNAHRAEGRDRAMQEYQTVAAALVALRQGRPGPSAIATGPPLAMQNAYRQPSAGSVNTSMHGRPPHFAVAPYNHPQRYITPHHLQRYALYQAQVGVRQYPTQAVVQNLMQRHYLEWLCRRGPHIARRTLPRPTINQGAELGRPYYTRLPTFFGAQFLARGPRNSNSTLSLPLKNTTRTVEAGATNSTGDAPTTGNARAAGPIHPLSDPQAQVDRMKQWETRYFDSYWTGNGSLPSGSEEGMWARVVLPDLVLDPEDEVGYEGTGGQAETEGENLAG